MNPISPAAREADTESECPATAMKRLPFVLATYAMTDSLAFAEGVGWTSDGKSLEVRNVSFFCEHVLPNFFRHGNLSSFARQMNLYGFVKDDSKFPGVSHIFHHPYFYRNGQAVQELIKRKIGRHTEHQNVVSAVKKVARYQAVHSDKHEDTSSIRNATRCHGDFDKRLKTLEAHCKHLREQNIMLRASIDNLDEARLVFQRQSNMALELLNHNDAEGTSLSLNPLMPLQVTKGNLDLDRTDGLLSTTLVNLDSYSSLAMLEDIPCIESRELGDLAQSLSYHFS